MKDNKLIAEFMGLPLVPCNIGTEYGDVTEGYMHPKGDTPFTVDGLQYKYSWDWLMPVVQKIMDVSFFNGEPEDFYVVRDCIPEISDTYKEVVEFIKEYNNED